MERGITLERIIELMGNDSQEEFGKKIHMSQSNVSKMLKGTPPSASTLKALAEKYQVSVDWLLGLSDERGKDRILSREHLTYADVMVVLEALFDNNEIHTGYEYSGNYEDPSSICIDDKILLYLLSNRSQIVSANRDFYDMWLSKMLKTFSGHELLQWIERYDKEFEHYFKNQDSAEEVVKKMDKMRSGTLDTNGFMNIPDIIDEGLPFN